MGMHSVDGCGKSLIYRPVLSNSRLNPLCTGRTSHRSAENERAVPHSRFRFLDFRRRNSTTHTPRETSTPETEYGGTEPSVSESSSPRPTESENFVGEVEEGSLKRKRSASPGVTHPASPPLKRRKTPLREESDEIPSNTEVIPQPLTPFQPMLCEHETVPPNSSDEAQEKVDSDKSLPLGPSNQLTASATTMPTGLTKQSPVRSAPNAPSWANASAIVAAQPSSAFQAFSGTPSAFANACTTFSQESPVWSAPAGDIPALACTPDPLAALSYARSTQTTLTGEEDESVVAELKGAKVFIKRGDHEFCEGILGNVRLLKHKESGRERILFRRELVLKVSMNVRLHPVVRCSLDDTQGLLRIVLKEPVADSAQEQQVVVYALKVRLPTQEPVAKCVLNVRSAPSAREGVADRVRGLCEGRDGERAVALAEPGDCLSCSTGAWTPDRTPRGSRRGSLSLTYPLLFCLKSVVVSTVTLSCYYHARHAYTHSIPSLLPRVSS
ncbi:hypothetical protein BD413DRAFT_156647 [Trametes elegans]|nr:hypothetical protein BD413DRAFT_156647 [Trametes elegans]